MPLMVRLPRGVHRQVVSRAARDGVSLNQWIIRALEVILEGGSRDA